MRRILAKAGTLLQPKDYLKNIAPRCAHGSSNEWQTALGSLSVVFRSGMAGESSSFSALDDMQFAVSRVRLRILKDIGAKMIS